MFVLSLLTGAKLGCLSRVWYFSGLILKSRGLGLKAPVHSLFQLVLYAVTANANFCSVLGSGPLTLTDYVHNHSRLFKTRTTMKTLGWNR